MNTKSRRVFSTFALRFKKAQFRTTFKNHHQKRRMQAGKKKLKASTQLIQQRQKQQSSFGDFPKRDIKKLGIKKSPSRWAVKSVTKKRKNNPSLFQKAKKSIKRLEVEVAESRGYTKCLKELALDEATVLATAIEDMQAKASRMKKYIKILSTETQISNHFIAGMLAVFEAAG